MSKADRGSHPPSDIVVTGLGAVSPCGWGVDALCASSAMAIGGARRALRRSDVDVARTRFEEPA
jgi:hypothetical protein